MSQHGRDGVVATADLLAALAERDPGRHGSGPTPAASSAASQPSCCWPFDPANSSTGSVQIFVRLELALSTLEAGPGKALAVLESFDERFWTSLGVADWLSNRTSERHGFFFRWLSDLHERVRTGWTAAARRLADTDLIAAQTTMRRFLEVAGWIDAAAVKHIPDMREPTDLWITHLPFFTATAAATLPEIDPAGVDDAIRRSVKLASTLSSPARDGRRAGMRSRGGTSTPRPPERRPPRRWSGPAVSADMAVTSGEDGLRTSLGRWRAWTR